MIGLAAAHGLKARALAAATVDGPATCTAHACTAELAAAMVADAAAEPDCTAGIATVADHAWAAAAAAERPAPVHESAAERTAITLAARTEA